MELRFLHFLQSLHHPIWDEIMILCSKLGDAGIIWIVLTILFLCIPKYRKCGCMMAMALMIEVVICNGILKNLVARERPCWIDHTVTMLIKIPKDFSFPSGHTSAAFATVVPMLYMHRRKGILALILAVAIAFSRMYLFVHFPTDILGGMIIGILSGILAILLVQKMEKRRKKHCV